MEKMGTNPPSSRFQENMGLFADFIRELANMPETSAKIGKKRLQMISLGCEFLKAAQGIDLIDGFIVGSVSYWDQIQEKRKEFFKDNASKIFGFAEVDMVNDLKEIIAGNLAEEDENILWDYFHGFVKISINHIHEMRQPRVKNGQACYTASYRDAVNITHHARKWGLNLKFGP